MLIDFSVENFKSIKDEALLSLVATPAKEHREAHVVTAKRKEGSRPISLLRSAAIYGPNAAGKTNFISALRLMQDYIVTPGRRPSALYTTPFLFDSDCKTEPTTFDVVCMVDRVRYQYGFSLRRDAVVKEWLYAWPHGRVQTWFERQDDTWKLGNKLSGDKEVWRRATRPDALFLSTAASLNSDQLRPVYDWFRDSLLVVRSGIWGNSFSTDYCRGEGKTSILDFLKAADLQIEDLRITEEDFTVDMLPGDTPSEIKDRVIAEYAGTRQTRLWLSHDTGSAEPAELQLIDESDGTQKIFALAGFWLSVLKNGHVLVVDELHAHLHPKLVRFLVDLFHDPKANTQGAQLIFTTHDTSLLDQDFIRRDQVWFCERNARQETQLFPLTDFRPRKGLENLERAYLAGRYGALPRVRPAHMTHGT